MIVGDRGKVVAPALQQIPRVEQGGGVSGGVEDRLFQMHHPFWAIICAAGARSA